MIKLRNIDRYIDKRLQRNFILKGIDLDIAEGDFVSIMGPSGAGKSTLLNIIGFLDDANEGEYFFLDEPVHGLNEKQKSEYHRSYIGFVFQVKGSQRKSMVADMLDRFNIVAKKDLFPNQLSGGQQQLVGVARALIGSPKLILADEPTGNLHSDQSKEIMQIFKKLNQEDGVTIIQVTHSDEMASYGDRVINLQDGAVTENNPYEEE